MVLPKQDLYQFYLKTIAGTGKTIISITNKGTINQIISWTPTVI